MAEKSRRKGDDAFVIALASGQTVRAAAASANISERVAYRRLADPVIVAKVSQLRAEAMEAAAGSLAATMSAAIHRIRVLVDSENPQVALSAARAVLDYALKLRHELDFQERLKAIERALGLDPKW